MTAVTVTLNIDAKGVATLTDQVPAAFRKVDQEAKNARGGVDSFDRALKQLGVGAALTALVGTMTAAGKAAITMAGEFEQTRIGFTTMLGSAQAADAFLKELASFAAKTPFEFPELTDAAKRLLAMGFAAHEVVPTMKAVGDAVAGLGGGGEMIGRVTTALGQMQAKGKVSAEEMLQLAEAGIPAWRFLADTIGTSIPDAMAKVSSGAVSAEVGIRALVDGMNKDFGGLMEKQSETLLGRFSTLKDELSFILRDFGTQLLPVLGQLMDGFTNLIPRIKEAGGELAKFAIDAVNVGRGVALFAGSVKDLVSEMKFLSGPLSVVVGYLKTMQTMVLDVATLGTHRLIPMFRDLGKAAGGGSAKGHIAMPPKFGTPEWEARWGQGSGGAPPPPPRSVIETEKAAKAAAAALKKATEEHEKWLASLAHHNQGKFMGPTMGDLTGQLQGAYGRGSGFAQQAMLGPTFGKGGAAAALIDLTGVGEKGDSFGKLFAAGVKTGLGSAMKDLPNVIMGAIQGGGNVGAAIGSLFGASIGKSVEKPVTDALGKALGPKLGGALGSMIPGIGAAVGPLLGGLAGKIFGGLFGGEGKEVNKLRDKFIESAGGLDVLRKKATDAGIGLERLLAAKKVTEFDAAMKELNGRIAEHQRITALTTEAHDKTREAFDRYNIAVESRGVVGLEEMHQKAAQLLTDFTLMSNTVGVDMAAVMDGMSGTTSEWLNQMIGAGQEIPLAMKPMLIEMAKAGELTKANGEAFSEAEVEGMTFAQTMTQMFTDLIQKLNEWVDALRGVPASINTSVNAKFGDGSGGSDWHDEGMRPFAKGGTAWVPTRALIGEAGPEDVVPHNQREAYARNVLRGNFGGAAVTNNITVNGGGSLTLEQIVEAVERGTDQGLKRAMRK